MDTIVSSSHNFRDRVVVKRYPPWTTTRVCTRVCTCVVISLLMMTGGGSKVWGKTVVSSVFRSHSARSDEVKSKLRVT